MSIFGDIADAVTDVASKVEGVASDISHSAIGKLALNGAGSIFGDPTLGDQVSTATGIIDNIFGRGSAAGKLLKKQARPTTLHSPNLRAPSRTKLFSVRVNGRAYRLTMPQLQRLARLRAVQPLAPVNPITIASPPPPPRPPSQPVQPTTIGALLANPDAVAAAVQAGAPIVVNGTTIDTTKPIAAPNTSIGNDLAALGLIVNTPQSQVVDERNNRNYHGDN